MQNVFYAAFDQHPGVAPSILAKEVFQRAYQESRFNFVGQIPLKVHFGEKGNKTFVKPENYSGIIEALAEMNVQALYIETNVLYRGSRTTRDAHIAVAKAHGFTNLPIEIADGERGESYVDVPIYKDYFETCKIGAGFAKYPQMVVTSHFKGHGMAGFGGALKQLAMGFAARGGKMAQHSAMIPTVSESKCTACGLCVKKCDVGAIQIAPKAKLDGLKCIGCAGCIAVCPVGAIRNDWSADNFKEKMAEYAFAAQLNKEIIYVSYIMNITAECDCMGSEMKPIATDVGVVASLDPVALDQASLDLLSKHHGHPLFEDGTPALEHAQKIGLGQRAYHLIEI